MPDMDGFKLLEHVGLEMDLPVISQFSATEKKKNFLLNAKTYLAWFLTSFVFEPMQ